MLDIATILIHATRLQKPKAKKTLGIFPGTTKHSKYVIAKVCTCVQHSKGKEHSRVIPWCKPPSHYVHLSARGHLFRYEGRRPFAREKVLATERARKEKRGIACWPQGAIAQFSMSKLLPLLLC